MSSVELDHVTVKRSDMTVLDDVNLAVADGELMGIVGASGSGKTMLLRAIAGVEPLAAGAIRIGGVDVTHSKPSDRGVAMVFQTPQLIPRRDVRGNIAFPLEIRHDPPDEISMRVEAESHALHIESLLARAPSQLSAGERQLVQVARALVQLPALLLLDEPLARLDAATSQRMRMELRSLQRGYGVTTFVATSDPVEAMALPDRLVVLDNGRVVQVGSPEDVFEMPVNLVAAECTGPVSIVTAVVEADVDGFWLVHPSFRYRAWRPSLADFVGAFVVVAMRPRWMSMTSDGPVRGTVIDVGLLTGTITVALDADSRCDRVEIATAASDYRRGDVVTFRVDDVDLFDPVTGYRLA